MSPRRLKFHSAFCISVPALSSRFLEAHNFFISLFAVSGYVFFPLVDDFSNNLAADLALILALFGEQMTKQYLSESITMVDYFIFAMRPIGILTAIISAIRVCGSPSLRAFIGRAQEGGGIAKAELCSSTSRDVCELYNNGGSARVFGRPKLLVVFDPANAGIYTFPEHIETPHSQKEWIRGGKKADLINEEGNINSSSAVKDSISGPKGHPFAPNLSLNVGIKKHSRYVLWAIAVLGFLLQYMNGSIPESYSCLLMILGTNLVCSEVFFCAYLVGQGTNEQNSCIYSIQPGSQVLGDQVFDALAYCDNQDPLEDYTTSWRGQLPPSEFAVAGLRMQRLTREHNLLANYSDEVIGHELD
ncbi:hypothetical protein V2W45_1499862 [Cenococcum geophilum]